MPELQFNEQLHQYSYAGEILPSVTQIISAVGLYEFDHVSGNTLAVAAERGRFVHTMIEWDLLGTLDELSIDEELLGYFTAYRSARAAGAIPAGFVGVEERVFTLKYRYAGCIDIRYPTGVFDHKTGGKSPVHGLQLSAYWLALHDEDITIQPEFLRCGYYSADGKWDVVDYPYEPIVWLAVNADYRWREKNNCIKKKWRQ